MTNNFVDPADRCPEFIDADPRVNRYGVNGYPINKNFMLRRHYHMFKTLDLTGKRVLDLGSCTGYTGAFVLSNGASYYRGIELNKTFSDLSINLLSKYFSNDKWDIQNISAEEALNEEFDIVVASGILYTFFDIYDYMKKIVDITKESVIVDSYHPHGPLTTAIIEMLDEDTLKTAVEHSSYIDVTNGQMFWGDNINVFYPRSNPSAGFVKYYMDMISFECYDSCNDSMKAEFPRVYNHRPGMRFMYVFNRVDKAETPTNLKDALNAGTATFANWK